MKTLEVNCGGVIIGGGRPVVVQTMCNTHTCDIDGTVAQCRRMAAAGAEIIRITVPGLREVADISSIKLRLRAEGIDTPLVADIHFSSETAIAVPRDRDRNGYESFVCSDPAGRNGYQRGR